MPGIPATHRGGSGGGGSSAAGWSPVGCRCERHHLVSFLTMTVTVLVQIKSTTACAAACEIAGSRFMSLPAPRVSAPRMGPGHYLQGSYRHLDWFNFGRGNSAGVHHHFLVARRRAGGNEANYERCETRSAGAAASPSVIPAGGGSCTASPERHPYGEQPSGSPCSASSSKMSSCASAHSLRVTRLIGARSRGARERCRNASAGQR